MALIQPRPPISESRPQKNASAIDVRITTIYYFNDYATTTALNREVSCSNWRVILVLEIYWLVYACSMPYNLKSTIIRHIKDTLRDPVAIITPTYIQ